MTAKINDYDLMKTLRYVFKLELGPSTPVHDVDVGHLTVNCTCKPSAKFINPKPTSVFPVKRMPVSSCKA